MYYTLTALIEYLIILNLLTFRVLCTFLLQACQNMDMCMHVISTCWYIHKNMYIVRLVYNSTVCHNIYLIYRLEDKHLVLMSARLRN